MIREKPSKACIECKRFVNGKRTMKCNECRYNYTAERSTARVFVYHGQALTVREWADLACVDRRTIYRLLAITNGRMDAVLNLCKRKALVDAIIDRSSDNGRT